MIEAIREIGGIILQDDSSKILDNLILDIPSEIKGKKQHVVIIDYRIFDKSLDIDFEEIADDTSRKYLWVGNADASRSHQIYFTTNRLDFLLSQTIPNNIQLTAENTQLGKLLRLLFKELFIDLGISGKKRYLLDWNKVKVVGNKLDIFNSDSSLKKEYEGFRESAKNAKKKKDNSKELQKRGKDISERVSAAIESKAWELMKTKTSLSKKEINLFTLKINGRLMINDEEYRKIIVREKIDSLFKRQAEKLLLLQSG